VADIKITKRGDRGFHQYGEPFRCTYRTEVAVYESSSAEGPRVWLRLTCDPRYLKNQPEGEGTAHLNEEQARTLVAMLTAWLDEIPSRWGQEVGR